MTKTPQLKRTINVLGTDVKFFDNGEFHIMTDSMFEANSVQQWLLDEGVFELPDEQELA